ncbi:MAG TPA: hypothetical protein VN417_02730 [Candidatus Cryosericum sp.]|nr:hypothetical protein [Candidatus Cryosericum sp.]
MEAYISGGGTVTAFTPADNPAGTQAGSVVVEAYGDTDGAIYANASATKAKIGVGVAVAINVVTYDTLAHIDNVSISADSLHVLSHMIAAEKKEETAADTGTGEPKNIIEKLLEQAITEMVKELADAMGLGGMLEKSTLDEAIINLIGDLVGSAVDTLLSGTGLEGLVSTDIEAKITSKLATLGTTLTDTLKTQVAGAILNAVLKKIQETVTPGSTTPETLTFGEQVNKMVENITNELFSEIVDVTKLKEFFKSGVAEQLKTKFTQILKDTGKALTTAALDALSGWLDLPIEETDLGPGHEFITQAVAGAGASEVGIAGSAAIAVIIGNTKAYLSDSTSRTLYPVNVTGVLEIDAYARQCLKSVASSAVGDDGMADKNLTAGGSSDTGDGSSAGAQNESTTVGQFVIGSMQNGKVTVSGNKLTVAPDEGYKLATGTFKATRSDTGATITLTDNGDGTYTYTAPTGTGALPADAKINISASFEENLKNISVTAPTNGTLTVKDLTKSSASNARMGERLLVTAAPTTGYVLDYLEYSYSVEGTSTTKRIVSAEDRANGVYTFYMPDADITVRAVFRALATGETPPATNTNTNSKGKSVGVGAAFALNIAYFTVEASVGKFRSLTSGTASVSAEGRHDLETVSVSGTDPLSGTDNTSSGGTGTTTEKPKDISLDAAASVGLSYNTIQAVVAENALITTTGDDTYNLDKTVYEEGDPAAEQNADYVNFYLGAKFKGTTLTKASGFAVGSSTAVGAAVAVNIAYSDVKTLFAGEGSVSGKARITSYIYAADDSHAIATAMGADMDRMLGKFRKGVDGVEKKTSDIAQGNYTSENTPTGNENNQTAGKINGELDKNNDTQTSGGTNSTQANNNLPLSTNAMRSQDTSTTGTPNGATGQANSTASSNTNGLTGANNQTQSSKIQVAAAVAVNITHHEALVNFSGKLTAESVAILADNDGNFRSLGTGAAMSLASKSNSIAVGVAVSVNDNSALVTIDGELTATAGNLTAEAQLTQNMDGKYKGLLGAQALAGSVTGSQSDMTISGALAIIVSKAFTSVNVLDGAKLTAENGQVKLSAEDQSKLAVRAGGLSVSKGTSVGVGASFALVFARNTVQALVGENVQIKAASFLLRAAKQRVDFSDYQSKFDLSLLLTDSTGVTDPDAKKGIIDIKKGESASDGYSVSINISTDTVLDAIDLLNFLSSNNYYAESIAGAISGGTGGKASVAGAVACVFFFNVTQAKIGSGTVLDISGDAQVSAEADTTARLIAGALSASSSKVGVGLTVASIANSDQVLAELADSVQISAGGKYTQNAITSADFLAVTIAASVTTSGTGVGGVIDAIVMDNHVSSIVGASALISAGSDIAILASAKANLLIAALSLAGSGSATAVGGTLAVVVNNTVTLAEVENAAHLTSTNGAITVCALSEDEFINVLAAASVSGGGTAVAGTLGVLIALNQTSAKVDDGAVLTGKNDVSLLSSGKTWMLVLGMSLSAASQNAVGATISVCVFQRAIKALVGANAKLTSTAGNVIVQANGENWALQLTLGVAGAGSNALNGTIPVFVGLDTVWTEIGQSAELNAYGSVGVLANLDNHTYVVSGGLAASGSNAFGATLSTVVYTNTVKAIVGQSTVILSGGAGTGLSLPNRASKRRGVFISATANEDMVLISISASLSGSAAVTGVINTLVMKNIVHALVQPSANITASGTETYTVSEDGEDKELSSGDVEVDADDDSLIINLAGSLSASGSVGVGATIVVLVFLKTVTADVSALCRITAGGSVRITANAKDDLFLLAIAFGASGNAGIAGGANALVFQNAATAALGGIVSASKSVTVSARTDSLLVNAALAIGGGGTAGVTAIAVITYFYNSTLSYIHTGARVTTTTGDINIYADSQELVTADAAGVAIGGTAGVGGTLDIIITQVITKAYTEASVTLNAHGSVDIEARDTYGLIAVVITIGGAGVAGVGVSILASVSFNTIEASVGAGSVVTAGGSIKVLASSNRDVLTIVTSVGIGGAAGVGVSLSIVVAGNKMSQDAHDAIYGNETQEQYEKGGQTYYVYLDADGVRLYELRSGSTSTLYRLVGGSLVAASYTGTKTAVMVNAGMDPQNQTDYAFTNANPSASSAKPTDSMDTLLAGDGQNTSDLDPGSSDYGQDEGSQDAMNDDTYDDTVNNSSVASSRIGNLKDSTSAVVYASARLTANGSGIAVTASDRLNANMIAGSLGGGGYAGVGVGLAVSVLFSNVNALVESGAVLSAPNGTINVSASAGSQSKTLEDINSDAETANDEVKDKISNTTTSTIRLIGITAGGGFVGVGVTVAVLLVFTEVHAIMAGNVENAKNVLVHAGIDYGQVLTGTLAITGGAVAVSVSGSVTYFQANVVSAIGGSANLTGVTHTISVTTTGNTNAIAAAASAGGGAVAVNAGMALTINRTRVDTFIGQGVVINAPNAAITVETQYTANAIAFTFAFSGGAVAVGATLAIVVNLLDSYTYIGVTPVGTAVSGSTATTKGSIRASSVKILSNVAGITTVFGVGVAGGAVAVNGIVALGFNRAVGYAALCRADVEAATVTVTAILSGDTTVVSTSLVIGGVAVGATVALAQITSKNVAQVDLTGSVVKAGTLNVNAGTPSAPYNSQAIVTVVTGTAGSYSAALNFAIALNASSNKATVFGVSGSLTGTNINIYAEGNTRAYAVIANASIGGFSINISASIAWLKSTQEASLSSAAAIALTGALNVTSKQNTTLSTYSNFLLRITEKITDVINGKFSAMAQAYIFSASAGVAVASANVAVATADATGKAIVKASNLTAGGAINVYNYGSSTANAKVDNITFAIASAGLMTGYSYAAGTFEASLTSTGTITSGSVSVVNSFASDATTDLTPAAGGISASLFNIAANISLAESKSTGKAFISGTGLITTGAVTVSSKAKATANAVIHGAVLKISGVDVAVNEAYANVSAVQDAYIETVTLSAGSVDVSSALNDSENTGAVASVGSNGCQIGVEISYISGEVSLAQAFVSARSYAYIKGASLAVTGAVSVNTAARSYANADILESQFALSVYGVTLLSTVSKAEGDFRAYIDTTGATLNTGSLTVNTTYYAVATAAVGAAGGLGVSLASVTANSAVASNHANAKSYILGSGALNVNGSVTILTEGYANSAATGRTRQFEISALKIAVNVIVATLSIEQSAYLDLTGSLQSTGALNIRSEIYRTGDFGSASATVGGSGAGVDIALIGATVNAAGSFARSINSAYITGSGSISADSVSVKAKTVSESKAIARKNFTVGLLTIGSLSAIATTGDSVSATISGVDLEATSGDVSILALGSTNAYALCEQPGGVGLGSASSSVSQTYIGVSGAEQSVTAGISGGSKITASGNVSIRAYNTGSAESVVQRGTTAAVVAVSSSQLPTSSYYKTLAYVIGNSTVTAGGSIDISSEDYTVAKSDATGTQIGFGINANSVQGSNTLNVTNTVNILAVLSAGTSLSILATSNANLYARTYADGGGFFSGDKLKAVNSLTRSTAVYLLGGSQLTADFGDLVVKASAGANDNIRTMAKITSGGVVALGKAEAKATVNSTASVSVGAGVSIYDRYNTVKLVSDSSLNNLSSTVEVNTSGLGVRPLSEANTTVTLNSNVTLTGSSASKIVIEGRYVNLESLVGSLYIYSYTYANGKALGADVDADTDMNIHIASAVSLTNASVTGHDKTYIAASARPAYRSNNIYGVATARLNAIGEAVANVSIYGGISSTTAVNSGVVLTGADINVTHTDYNASRTDYKRNTSGFIVKRKTGGNDLNVSGSASVASGTKMQLGDAAGGIHIDISGTAGNYVVRQVGIKNEAQIWSISDGSITFRALSNALPGTANLNALYSTLDVYDQSYLPEVTIDNHTALNIVLNGVTVQNINFIKPIVRNVFGIAVPLTGSITLHTSLVTAPSITVTNEQDGDVRITGLIANSGGSVSFLWTGTTGGALSAVKEVTSISAAYNVSPVWANKLTIVHAASIGAANYLSGTTTVEQSFNAYLFNTASGTSQINATATGGIYLKLTAAELLVLNSTEWAQSPWASSGASSGAAIDMRMQNIVSAQGDVVIVLPQGVRAYQLANTSTVSMPVPGTLEYITDALVSLLSNLQVVGLDALSYYLLSYNAAEDVYCFLLPNDTCLYTDALGNVVRISEGGIDFAVSDYGFTTNASGVVTSITLSEGVTIDLVTGMLTVETGNSYDVLLSVVKGSWLINNIMLSSGSIDLVLSTTITTFENNVPVYEFTDKVVTLSRFWSYGTLTYYYISGLYPKVDDSGEYYVLAYDSTADTFQAFLFSGAVSSGSSASSDHIKTGNMVYKDGALNVLTMNSGNSYYELIKANYNGNIIDTAVSRASQVYTISTLCAYALTYNYNTNSWSYNGQQLTIQQVNGMYYVPDNYTVADSTLNSLYASLKGKYWTLSRTATQLTDVDGANVMNGNEFCFAVFNYSQDGTNHYWVNRTAMYSYTLNVDCVTLTPLCLTLAENESKGMNAGTTKPNKDYVLTFGTPAVAETFKYIYTAYILNDDGVTYTPENREITEQGYAGAMLTIQGKISNIPLKLINDIPANNMVSTTSGYRVTETLYVTASGIALMINPDITVFDNKAFAAKFDGSTYHSDYLDAEHLGKTSEYNKLSVDENGSVIYKDANGYIFRLEGEKFVYTGTKSGVADITGASALAIIQNGFFLTAIVDGSGNITGYQTGAGVNLTQDEALCIFAMSGAGTFKDASGNLYFFANGQLIRRQTGVADISGAVTKQWLLDHADYTYPGEGGGTYIFSRDITAAEALQLVYGVTAEEPYYTDANGNVYKLIGDNLVYQGAPSATQITAQSALDELNASIVGFAIGEKWCLYYIDQGTHQKVLSGQDAAYLLYTLITESGGATYYKIDATDNQYKLDSSGNLIYSGTPLPSGTPASYTTATLPATATVLESDDSGNAQTMNVGGYIYNVIYTTTTSGETTTTTITYTYSGLMTGVSNISAGTMVSNVEATANRLYDLADLSKQFAASTTASEALALLYPTTSGKYTDNEGYIYTLVSGNLVYSGERTGVTTTISGADWRDELVSNHDGYYYNGVFFTSLVTDASALTIRYPIVNGVYQSGTNLFTLSGSSLLYTGSVFDLPSADTSAYKALQTLTDVDGNVVGYTHIGVTVSEENALKLFKLLGTGTFKDSSGNLYCFVEGNIVRTEPGVSLPSISGESAIEWLMSHANGYFYIRNGVTYTFDENLTPEQALRICYDLKQGDDEEWYYTHSNGSVYKLVGGDLVYDSTPATLPDITSADALITLGGMIVGYKNGSTTVYLETDGTLSNESAASLYFTLDGDGYYVDASGDRYSLILVTPGTGDPYYELQYVDSPATIPDLTNGTGLTSVTIPGDSRDLYVNAEGQLFEKKSNTQYVYIGEKLALDDTYVTVAYALETLIAQILSSADRVYLQGSAEKTFTAAEQTLANALKLVYGVDSTHPDYTDASGYIYSLNIAGTALVYSGQKANVTPETISGADTLAWLNANYTGWVAQSRNFLVTPPSVPGGDYTFNGTGAEALRLVYDMGTSSYYTDMNGNVYELSGDALVYVGTRFMVDDLTGTEALQWLYPIYNGVYTDDDQNQFLLVGGNLIYTGTAITLADITGSAFDAIYYIYKAVENTGFAVTMRVEKKIHLERLTDTIATDIKGRYYSYTVNSSNKTVATLISSVTKTTEETTRVQVVLGDDGVTVVSSVTQQIQIKTDTIVNGSATTVVERIYVLNELNGMLELDSVMIQLPNLTKVYSDGRIELSDPNAQTMHIVLASGVVYKVGYIEATLGNIILTMHDSAGSLLDGNASLLNLKAGNGIDFFMRTTGTVGAPTKLLDVSAGGKVMVYDISGDPGLVSSSIYLFVPAAEGSLTLEENTRIINGATYHVETENGNILGQRVEVIAGNLILDAHSNGSDPNVTGEIIINTLIVHYVAAQDAAADSEKVYFSSADLDAEGDIEIGSLTANDNSVVTLTSTGGGLTSNTWSVDDSQVTANVYGNIAITALTANNDSTVSLTSSNGGLTSGTWNVDDSQVTASVYGEIAITALTAENGSTVSLTSANGSLTSTDWTVDNSALTALVHGDIAVESADLTNGSTTLLTSTNGGLSIDELTVNGSKLVGNIYGGITIPSADVRGSEITLYSKAGGLAVTGLYLSNSEWTASVFGDVHIPEIQSFGSDLTLLSTDGSILFNNISATKSNVSLLAYQNIGLLDSAKGNPLIVFAKDDTAANASLTLSAKFGDIGSTAQRLMIDIPAEITVRINEVEGYYIDAVDLPLSAYPFYAIFGGWDGTAPGSAYLTGVYLRYSDVQFFESLLGVTSPEEIAVWIAQRSPARDYLNSIDATVLWTMTHSAVTGLADLAALKALFGKTLGTSLYTLMTSTAPTVTTKEQLLQALTNALKAQTGIVIGGVSQTVYTVDETIARAMLAMLIRNNALTAMGELMGGLLTAQDLQVLYQSALGSSTTPSDTYTDVPARAFHLSVGRSTGTAFVTNQGDITIRQDNGDITVGEILSARGNVTLEALAGSILAASSDSLVTGWNITLNAQGDVGTQSMPIRINQRTNHVINLVNVDEELYTGDLTPRGKTAFNTEFGVKFDPSLAGSGLPPVIVPAGAGEVPNDQPVYELVQVTLKNADGSPVLDANGNAVTVWALRVAVRYDWLRITFNEESTALNVQAGGGVYVAEQSGNLGIGVVGAGEDISLSAPGSVTDERDSTQIAGGQRNITSGGDVELTFAGGSIGASAAKPLLISCGGSVNAVSKFGAYLDATSDLNLDLTSASGDIALTSTGRVLLVSRAASALKGFVKAGYGVSIDAAGDIGTKSAPLILDANRTGAGTLSLAGGNVYASETAGDVYLEHLFAKGEAVLRVSGSLYDANTNSALGKIIQKTVDAQLAVDLLKNSVDAAQARVDVLTQYLAKQAALLLSQTTAKDAALASLTAADLTLTNAKNAALAAQSAYDTLLADPGASEDAISQALETLNTANLAEANANAAYLAASASLTAAQAAADATQLGIDGANALITAEQLAQKQLLLTAAREKLARQKALLTAQVAVNDAAIAAENAQNTYYAVLANTASTQAQKDAAALALRHAGGALETARYFLSIQNAINDASDVLAEATATAADKLAAQNTLDQANLAYAEALSLQAIYSNAGVSNEALDLADALLSAQGIAALAESAYALDPSAANLSALTQATNTLQAAKDAMNAWNVYLPAHETSQTAQSLNSAIEQAALDAATAQSILDAFATLASRSATAAEKSAAKALIASYGLTKTQAKAALAQANTDKAKAETALNALLTQNGLASVQAAIDAESAAHTALNTAEAALNAFAASNAAQQVIWDAEKRLDDANTQYGVISSLISLKNAAVGALAAAQTAMETAYQNWVDARLTAGTDEDAAVQTALNEYLATQAERDDKSAALDAVKAELALLPTLSEAQDEIDSAEAALTLAEQALTDALAAQPAVTQDSFGADFAADDITGVELPTIRTGGNLTLYTGGNAGTASAPLTLDAAGAVLLQAGSGGTVSLASAHSLQLDGVTGGTVTIAVNGSIQDVSPSGAQMITADRAILYAIGGSISGSYAKTNINYFSGFADAIYLENLGALELGPVAGYVDGVFIIAGGAITQIGGGFLQGPSVVLNAGGDIGTPSNLVLVNTQSLTANGGNLYLSSIGHLNTVNLSGGNVVLLVGGNLSGGNIRAKNLTLLAFGSIGSANNPLRLVVPGALVVTSQYGEIYYTNQLIRSTFLVSILLAGDSRMMLLIRFGQTIQGGLVILNVLMVKLDDLSGIGDTLNQAGIRSLDMALIENAGESSAALIKTLQTAFPKAKIVSSVLLWLAQMRASIAQDDWKAMLNDLEAIYRTTSAEALTSAAEAFTARWQEAYSEITARLAQEAADPAGMLETFAVMRQAGLELTMFLNSLSDALAQTNLP